jgi:hypothetical protein
MDEIELTPEMIEAGALEIARGDTEFESLEEVAERVFRAMLAHRYG